MPVGENTRVFRSHVLRGLRASLLASVFVVPAAYAGDSLTDAFVKTYQSNPQLLSERSNLRATVSQFIGRWRKPS